MKKNYFFGGLILSALLISSAADAQTVTTFNYTGAMDTWVVPPGVTSVEVDMVGASGGWDDFGGSTITSHIPGDGGRVQTTLTVTPGATLYIYVGGIGGNASSGTGGTGGFNGGANGGTTGTYSGGGGGGASDIRIGGTTYGDRVVVAGGAGGAAYNYSANDNGGDGGDLTGANGQSNGSTSHVSCGLGGTQSAGGLGGQWSGYNQGGPGAFGTGGAGATGTSGGGGGAGYYGGGGGSWSGGGGGSSYTDAVLCSSTTHTQGYNTGNGQVIITVLCTPLTVTVSNSTVCEGEMVTLDATSAGGGTITWDNGVTNAVPFTPGIGTTTYLATSSDGNDCAYTVDITVNALPAVFGFADDAVVCSGDMITLFGAGASTYTWSGGVTDGIPFTPSGSGLITYTVTGTDINGCENTDDVDIMISDLTFMANIAHEVSGGDGAIDLTVLGGTGTYTYSWSSGPSTEDISGLTAGAYTVTVDDGACISDSTFTVLNVSGVDEEVFDGFNVYPNPTNGIITISQEGNFAYVITTLTGEIIFSNSGFNTEVIDLSNYATGVYFVEVMADGYQTTMKIIKH